MVVEELVGSAVCDDRSSASDERSRGLERIAGDTGLYAFSLKVVADCGGRCVAADSSDDGRPCAESGRGKGCVDGDTARANGDRGVSDLVRLQIWEQDVEHHLADRNEIVFHEYEHRPVRRRQGQSGDTPMRPQIGADPPVTLEPLLAFGNGDQEIDEAELARQIERVVDAIVAGGAKRVLLVPPDHTRLYSRGGQITVHLDRALREQGTQVDVMPALGTHRPLGESQCRLLFGNAIGVERILEHRWRDDVVTVGEISAEEVREISGLELELSFPLIVNSSLVNDRYDMVVAPGQVVPHEVAGFGGYTKHLCIGLGGRETIHRSHFIGAMCGIEETMGRVDAPVRVLLNRAFDAFLEPRCRVLFVLTVVDDRAGVHCLRGLFVGEGGTRTSGGAAFSAAASLATSLNITTVSDPYEVCVAFMNPLEFHSTWLANKAIYRTRLAMADRGELIVVAPGVDRFGEDDAVDALIRRHGYHGREAALAAVAGDADLAGNLAAAAHLVHGSTEGRFRVRYCPGPGLTRADIEAVGFEYISHEELAARFGPGLDRAAGTSLDSNGSEFIVIPNAGLGLWRRGATPSPA